ncbi:MAG TPA: LysR substrate-binding domain-containing protein [Azospira sp.]|nr:LysR substrate-binding domain-containing protein [Azospira sp.]
MSLPLHRLPSLDPLKGFVAAARHLSFTKAGEELHLSQSAISRQVQTLEEQLGVALFQRSTRALHLTPAGERLYRSAGDLLSRLGSVVEEITASRRQPRVTVSTSIGVAALWLVPRLSGFQEKHPEIGVRISADNRAVDLEAEEVDVALRYSTPEAAPAGSLKLFEETLVPVASPTLAAALPDGPRLSAANLPHLTLLSFEDGRDYPWLRWEGWLSELAQTPPAAKGLLQFNHYDQCIYAARAGQGVALGRAPLIRDHLEAGRLVPLAPPRPTPGRRAYYLLRSTAAQRPEVEAFAGWLIQLGSTDNTVDTEIEMGGQAPSGT